jgi:hypothetical protein
VIVVSVAVLVATGLAARELGIDGGSLVRWWQHGLVTPAVITAGGHARWGIQELRQQLKDRRQRDGWNC